MEFQSISGSCHCCNIRFDLEWPKSEPAIAVRKCGCDYCSKHGGAWTSHPHAHLVVHIEDSSAVSKYSFATGTADFLVCASCGVVPLVLSDINGKLYAVVNINSFDDADSLTYSRSETNFDGEERAARLQRRERNWIPDVQVGEQVLSQ